VVAAMGTVKIQKYARMSSKMLQRAIPEIIAAYHVIKSVVQSLKFTWNFKVHNKISLYC